MSCCNNYIGSFPHNEDIETGISISEIGSYVILLNFNGAIIKRIVEQYGSTLVIEGPFNENYLYNFTVIDPNGNNVTQNDCENFSFQTYLNIDTNCDNSCD